MIQTLIKNKIINLIINKIIDNIEDNFNANNKFELNIKYENIVVKLYGYDCYYTFNNVFITKVSDNIKYYKIIAESSDFYLNEKNFASAYVTKNNIIEVGNII